MATLEERLDRLERRNDALERAARRWRLLGLGSLALAAGVSLIGRASARDDKNPDAVKFKAIEADSLTIVDTKGKTRLVLGVDARGAGLDVMDANGKLRIDLGEGTTKAMGEGTGLWAFDDQERPRVGLGLGKNGNGLVVLDEDGKPVAGGGLAKPKD